MGVITNQLKNMKWWHWTMLISGSVMIIGGIISIIIL